MKSKGMTSRKEVHSGEQNSAFRFGGVVLFDPGFTIYRNFSDPQQRTIDSTDFYNMKTKFSFQGDINGRVNFKYHLPSGRYYASGYNFKNESFLDQTRNEENVAAVPSSNLIPNLRPSESSRIEKPWDSPEDEIPF